MDIDGMQIDATDIRPNDIGARIARGGAPC
jgi:hypothetical protein